MAYGLETISSVMGGYGFDTTQVISREQAPNVTNLVTNGVISQDRYNGYRVWINVGGFDKSEAIIGSLNKPVDLAFGSSYVPLVNIGADDGLGAFAQILGAGSARYKFTTARFWKSSSPITINLDITVTEDDYVALDAKQAAGKIISFLYKLGKISLPSEQDSPKEGEINFTGMNPPGPAPYELGDWAGKAKEEIGAALKKAGPIGLAKGHRIMVKIMDFLFFDWMQAEKIQVEFSPTFVDYSKQVSSFSDTLKAWIAANVGKDSAKDSAKKASTDTGEDKITRAGVLSDDGLTLTTVRPFYAKFKIQLTTLYDMSIQDFKNIISFNEGNRVVTW